MQRYAGTQAYIQMEMTGLKTLDCRSLTRCRSLRIVVCRHLLTLIDIKLANEASSILYLNELNLIKKAIC